MLYPYDTIQKFIELFKLIEISCQKNP